MDYKNKRKNHYTRLHGGAQAADAAAQRKWEQENGISPDVNTAADAALGSGPP
jgi:hypothetical protein